MRAHPFLPIFEVELSPRGALLYVPPGQFCLVEADEARRLEAGWRGDPVAERAATAEVRAWCEARGREAEVRWRALSERAFAPECLTVALSRQCLCRCTYCFVEPKVGGREAERSWEAVEAAAALVGASCAAAGKAFSLVVHGGGEPTLHWDALVRLHALGRETAAGLGLELRGYVATNGLVSQAQARWLAVSFGHVGLSSDGPPEIHDRQRPTAGGLPTAAHVARTAAAVKGAGGRLTVRATITPKSMAHQEAIVEHSCRELGADDLVFEPCYRLDGPGAFMPEDAIEFARRFLAAQAVAAALGRELAFSGVRLDELHGPYCDGVRQVLRLSPDGRAVDCFVDGAGGRAGRRAEVGRHQAGTALFAVDRARLAARRREALDVPDGCRECIDVYHCSRGCPEVCRVDAAPAAVLDAAKREFRCRLHRALTDAGLRAACRLAARADRGEVAPLKVAGPGRSAPRLLPPPPWERYGYSHTGAEVWREIGARTPARVASSVYVHVPFCEQRCGFCDCLSQPLRPADEERFLRTLLSEVEAWGRLERVRAAPITTVHFGGGTANCLPPGHLERVVEALGQALRVDRATELALETTVGRATPEDLARLRAMGFRRLHLGIQTFDDGLRRRIGRRHGVEEARRAVGDAVAGGWITSIDLLYGLPGQPREAVEQSVREAIALGAHGVSLYRFNASPRNQVFIRRWGEAGDAEKARSCLVAGEALLGAAGYAKNHLSHYALPADRNLYYTHADRGEDLVALGPTADGEIDGWIYRHGDLEVYLGAELDAAMGLEGGLRLPPPAEAANPLVAALLCGRAERQAYEARGLGPLHQAWLRAGWLREAEPAGTSRLTAEGSWFIERLLSELLPPPPVEVAHLAAGGRL